MTIFMSFEGLKCINLGIDNARRCFSALSHMFYSINCKTRFEPRLFHAAAAIWMHLDSNIFFRIKNTVEFATIFNLIVCTLFLKKIIHYCSIPLEHVHGVPVGAA
jgi:hypothetical protein